MTHLETTPQHLDADFWAECLELREYLINELDGLVLGVGLREPGANAEAFITYLLAPNGDGNGVAIYNRDAQKWLIADRELTYLADILIEIPTLGRPALQVRELLRAAVAMLDIIE